MNRSTLRRANAGDAEAQHALGEMYDSGNGVPKDGVTAVTWFRKAAQQGHAKAQWQLGIKYAMGQVVPKDAVEAVAWFRKAAEQGDAQAQFNLGWMYHSGEGVSQLAGCIPAVYRFPRGKTYTRGIVAP